MNSIESKSPSKGIPQIPAVIACPFCAMVCDDLSPPRHSQGSPVESFCCAKANQGFSLALNKPVAKPMLRGKTADWPQAVERAAELLAQARLPLFHGLLGDLQDSRAAPRLAERFGGVIDHLHGDAIARNLSVFQDSGWQVTSLGEMRNRADLVILLADDLEAGLPRFAEKLFAAEHRLHAEAPAQRVALSERRLETLNQIRALLADKPLVNTTRRVEELTERLQAARYPVFVLGQLKDTRPELVLRAAVELVRELNEKGRAALLTLGGGAGDVTAQLSAAWHNGFGIRTSFAKGVPEQDLRHYSAERLLRGQEADLLVWFSSLEPRIPDPGDRPLIFIGHPATEFVGPPPEVFLPVAVPGVHRAGFLHRADGLRMVPLSAIQESPLPGSMEICEKLLQSTTGGDRAC